jgi:hypothetical protein
MNIQRNANKQMSIASQSNVQETGIFTLKRCLLILLIAAITFPLPSRQIWKSYLQTKSLEAQIEQFTRLEDSTMNRDEVLATAVKMAATTQNPKWVKQHKEIGPRIKAAIEEIKSVSEDDALKAGVI